MVVLTAAPKEKGFFNYWLKVWSDDMIFHQIFSFDSIPI